MVYQVGKMILQQTQEVFRGKVNDVIVCQDMAETGKIFYTVLVVHDRIVAKKMMELFHAKEGQIKNRFVADFTWKDSYIMVFDYVRERPLNQFFLSEVTTMQDCEQVALNLTVECLASGVPYPLLYLQLKQEQIHISKDKNIYLGYCINLEEYSDIRTESDCATLCAKQIFWLMEKINTGWATSYRLLEKKIQKKGYQRFTDLYKDLKMAAQPLKKEGIISRFKRFIKRNQDNIFRGLIVLCVILAVLAVVVLISQLIFGDLPFMRLFFNPFKKIGTEYMTQ